MKLDLTALLSPTSAYVIYEWFLSTSVYAIDVLSSKLQMSKILNVKGDSDTIEAIDFNTETPVIVLRHENQLLLSVWRREFMETASLSSYQCQKTFRALPDPVCNIVKDFDEARCQCMAIQVSMTPLVSNNVELFTG